MAKTAIPDRLIELAERWCSPYQWQALIGESSEIDRRRKAIDDTKLARHQYPEMASLLDYIIEHDENFMGDAERRYKAMLAETRDLYNLVEAHAVEFSGHFPRFLNLTREDATSLARGVGMLYGLLRARKQCRIRCNESDRSIHIDGNMIQANLHEQVFAYIQVLASCYPGSSSHPTCALPRISVV